MKTKKVYDFPFDKVKRQVMGALEKLQKKATVADIITATALPKFQVEKVMPVISQECRGLLQVTETGEILYYFPQGLSNKVKGWGARLKRGLGKFFQTMGLVFTWFFKVWMMAMLVVYFLIFLALLLLMVLGALAASAARKDQSSDKTSGFAFHLVWRVLEFAINLWIYSGPRNREAGKKRPFYLGAFSFVFGPASQEKAWALQEKKAFISFVQRQKGCITQEELMALTGRDWNGSNDFLNQALVEFEGEPLVSPQGSLYYFFPGLMKTSGQGPAFSLGDRPAIPFSENEASVNRWVVFFNLFNTVFAGYFLYFGLFPNPTNDLGFLHYFTAGLAGLTFGWSQPEVLVTWILGVIPGIYSVLFFGIPLVRRWLQAQKNRTIRQGNLRRRLLAQALENPGNIRPEEIAPENPDQAPFKKGKLEKWKEQVLLDLAQGRSLDPGVASHGVFEYQIQELVRQKTDMDQVRAKINPQDFSLGAKIFDTQDQV